jgi:hypothetical protein
MSGLVRKARNLFLIGLKESDGTACSFDLNKWNRPPQDGDDPLLR